MKKILVIAMALAFAGVTLGSPAQAALTDSQIQAILSLLTSFGADATTIANVNSSLHGTAPTTGGGTTAACSFTRSLFVGVSGTDVTCLQNYLIGAGFSISAGATGYYGSQTQAAVSAWQTANGVSPAAGYFGPVSQAKFASMGGTSTGTGGTFTGSCALPAGGMEGALTGTISATPASGQDVYIGQTGIGVAGIDLKASGSDIAVSRLTVNFNVRPWLYISGVTVTDGTTSKYVAVTSSNVTEVTVGSSYDLLIDGLCYLVPNGTTKTVTVKVDGISNLPSGTTSQAIVLTFGANAARGVDGKNINEYAPSAALSTRTFTVKAGDTSALELTASSDNPKQRNELVSTSGITTGVVLDKFNLKATNRDAILRTVEFLVSGGDTVSSGTVSAIYLYDGDTLLSSTSTLAAATSTFSNINLTIPKNTTKTLTIKADLNKSTGNYDTTGTATAIVTVEPQASSIAAEDSATFATATVTGSAVTSGAGYLFSKAPSLALSSASIGSIAVATGTVTYNGKAWGRIKLNLTANGGDIYVASSTANDVTATNSLASTAASTTMTEILSSNADASNGSNWVVRSGDTKWFETYAEVTHADDAAGDVTTYVYLTNLKWATTDAGASATYTNQTWALSDFKTTGIVLEAYR